MRLMNHTLMILSAILFVTVSLWALLFYTQLLKQVKETVDEGLSNHKLVIIDNLRDDSLVVQRDTFLDNNYLIRSVSEDYALQVRDSYKDTLVFSTLKNNSYQTRLLTTAFIASDGSYYELKVISHELDKGTLVKKIITSLLWLYLFLFISTIVVNNLVLKKTWKPFYLLLKYLDDFRLDRRKFRKLTDTRIKEFSMLNESVQNLLETNTGIYNSQKQFIENASHELQTPLAIGINKLELLAGDEDLSPDQIRKIGEIIEALQRLSGLNKSLLLLSKIENRQFIAEEDVDLNELFTRILSDFSDYVEFQHIKIDYQQKGNWRHRMNRDLAEMLVMNLLKNAIIHNRQGGELVIHLNENAFSIENTSQEPSMLSDTLFERFNKNSKKQNSTGLGLAIVKAITDVSGLKIIYSYTDRHIFSVSAS